MTEVPGEVKDLLERRADARAAKDFATADTIRDQIDALGFEVRDSPSGATAVPKPRFTALDPSRIESVLSDPSSCAISVHVLYEGFRDDVNRFIDSFERHCGSHQSEIVLTETASADAEWLDSLASDRVRLLHLDRDPGWAAARNAALQTSRGAIVALADLSVEFTGDAVGPLLQAFDDPAVGLAGPWGLRTADLRTFEDAEGPEVDAVEGYLLATRREILAKGLIDEKFTWYRHADIDFSFQVRALGYRAVVTPAPATRHTHRAWAALDEDERAKRSKRNFNRFLDHFRDRPDLATGP